MFKALTALHPQRGNWAALHPQRFRRRFYILEEEFGGGVLHPQRGSLRRALHPWRVKGVGCLDPQKEN